MLSRSHVSPTGARCWAPSISTVLFIMRLATLPLLAVVALSCCWPQAHAASPESEALGLCLADNTTGKDRKELARWIFVAMAVHPEIRDLNAVTPPVRTQADKDMAALITRLLTEACVKPLRQAVAGQNSQAALFDAFKSLGELAMRELMTNREVAESINGYLQYVDRKKLEDAFRAP